MSSKWVETGILRKKQTKENFDDLLVFGYACKLFRDDERALHIDQGKHLIPWMGDDRLKIDRYDARGTLSDLASCEASREGYDATRWLGCSDAERKLEQLCDEERYHSLYTNEEEEILYREEESKRKKANEFQYNYDVYPDSEENSQETVATCEQEDKIFVPPKVLNVPADIDIPKTVKENARVEKTALFVSQQGPQMEILIKAKQSANAQFSFLNKDDPLHKYYRHLLNSIKSGQYKPEEGSQDETDDVNTTTESVSTSDSEHYLHPILATPAASTPPPQAALPSAPAPVLQYKPTADCAYTQLVTRIKGSAVEKVDEPSIATSQTQHQDVSEQYFQAQYYQYYHQIAQQYATQGNCDVNQVLQNVQLQEQIQQQAIQYAQAACAHYSVPAPVPVAEEQPKATLLETPAEPQQKISLVHYSSDSDDHEEEDADEKSTFEMPPSDVALIIDKMATYVSKNGSSFEKSVKEKGDPRFDFLHDSHKYHKYYLYKVNEFGSKLGKEQSVLIAGDSLKLNNKPTQISNKVEVKTKRKESRVITAVSFSIKKTKDEPPKDIKSALPVEESDDERTTPPLPNVPSPVATPVLEPVVTQAESIQTGENIIPSVNGKASDQNNSIIEMIDLTGDTQLADKGNSNSKRLAEERIKMKLASAMRERQMERKKRAELFLKMQSERKDEDKSRSKSVDVTTNLSDSELEEGEIKHKEKKKDRHKKRSHKKSSKRRSRGDSKSRHRKSKKRKYSDSENSDSDSA